MIDKTAKKAARKDVRDAMTRLVQAARASRQPVDLSDIERLPEAPVAANGAAAAERGRKVPISIRLDPDLVEALRASGRGWQSRVNAALRDVMQLGHETKRTRRRS